MNIGEANAVQAVVTWLLDPAKDDERARTALIGLADRAYRVLHAGPSADAVRQLWPAPGPAGPDDASPAIPASGATETAALSHGGRDWLIEQIRAGRTTSYAAAARTVFRVQPEGESSRLLSQTECGVLQRLLAGGGAEIDVAGGPVVWRGQS